MAKKTDIFYPDRVVDGRLVTRAVLDLLRELEGSQVEVCIRPKRHYATVPQMRWYRGVCIRLLAMCMRDHGVNGPHGGPITDEQVHQMMAMRFLRETVCVIPETGECMDIVPSTSKITTARMSEYWQAIQHWAFEVFDLTIPNPEQAGDVRIA